MPRSEISHAFISNCRRGAHVGQDASAWKMMEKPTSPTSHLSNTMQKREGNMVGRQSTPAINDPQLARNDGFPDKSIVRKRWKTASFMFRSAAVNIFKSSTVRWQLANCSVVNPNQLPFLIPWHINAKAVFWRLVSCTSSFASRDALLPNVWARGRNALGVA